VAGARSAVPLHGRSLLGDGPAKREHLFAARDKMDETHDAMRAVRSKSFKLIHNLMPERPYCQYNRYKEGAYPMLAEMNILHMQGKLTPEQAAFMAPRKPRFELYDLENDPHEVRNLADDPAHAETKAALLKTLKTWRKKIIDDQGVSEEFRAKGVFADRPAGTVDDWVAANNETHDFNATGWPGWYPTRSLEEWQKARAAWEPYVMRGPNDQVARPQLVHSKRKKPKPKR